MRMKKESTEALLQAAIGSTKQWSNVPSQLRFHFGNIKVHATVMEDALQAILDSRGVEPRWTPRKQTYQGERFLGTLRLRTLSRRRTGPYSKYSFYRAVFNAG